jgi:O-methyltransferase involved in polyketide biosynthesis
MYLTRTDADQLLAAVTAQSAPGSRLAGEYFSAEWQESDAVTADEQETAAWGLMRQAFRYGPVADTPEGWLSGRGAGPGVRAARLRPARRASGAAVRRHPADRALTGRAFAVDAPALDLKA